MAQKDMVQKEKTDKKREPSQKERFIDAARKVETDETGETFDRAINWIVRKPRALKS